MKTRGPADRGQRQSNFHPDTSKPMPQVQQTVGTNPNPPAQRSASAQAGSVPPVPACILGPYTGLNG